jgi:hypothetical protein
MDKKADLLKQVEYLRESHLAGTAYKNIAEVGDIVYEYLVLMATSAERAARKKLEEKHINTETLKEDMQDFFVLRSNLTVFLEEVAANMLLSNNVITHELLITIQTKNNLKELKKFMEDNPTPDTHYLTAREHEDVLRKLEDIFGLLPRLTKQYIEEYGFKTNSIYYTATSCVISIPLSVLEVAKILLLANGRFFRELSEGAMSFRMSSCPLRFKYLDAHNLNEWEKIKKENGWKTP